MKLLKILFLLIIPTFAFAGSIQQRQAGILEMYSAAGGGGNATIEVDSVCEIVSQSDVWDSVHDDTVGSTGDVETGVSRNAGNSYYKIHRLQIRIPESSLPSSITVTLAQLRIYVSAKSDINSKDIDVGDSSYSGTCTSGAYDDCGGGTGTCTGQPTDYGSIAISAVTTSAYNTITLTAAARTYIQTQVNSDNDMVFMLRGSSDSDDDSTGIDPGDGDYVEIDHSVGSGNPIELYIEYN